MRIAHTSPGEVDTAHSFRDGVALIRKDGQPRRNFSEKERRRLLGHEEEFEAYLDLFAPRRTPFIAQKASSSGRNGWQTVQHKLKDDDVAKHLLRDSLPGVPVRWCGTRSWESTRFVSIDVDLRDDRADFVRRCKDVESTLWTLGIPREAWLVQQSPSGGRHYFFFTKTPVPIEELRVTFAQAGLVDCDGQHEIYPRPDRGFRLPFGHIPDGKHDRDEWCGFMRRLISGQHPRVNWNRCKKRARSRYERQTNGLISSSIPVPNRCNQSRRKVMKPLKPVRRMTPGGAKRGRQATEPYLQIIANGISSVRDATRLRDFGILLPGTRFAATNLLAWHFVFACKMSEQQAVAELVDWVYRTGKRTSTTVINDLATGRRNAEEQTRQILHWMVIRRDCRPVHQRPARRLFSVAEIDHLVSALESEPSSQQERQLHFLLEFLRFAKSRHGWKCEKGWSCCPSVRGIIRKWKFCSGMRYGAYVDWAIRVGIVEMTREKRQSSNGSGRARTYVVRVPRSFGDNSSLDFDDALAYAKQRLNASKSQESTLTEVTQSDTYEWIVSLKGKDIHKARERRVHSVSDESETTPSFNEIDPQPRQSQLVRSNNHRRSENDIRIDQRDDIGTHAQAGSSCRQYSKGPPSGLVQVSTECDGVGNAVSRLRDSSLGREPTILAAAPTSTDQLIEQALNDPWCSPHVSWLLDSDPLLLGPKQRRRRSQIIARLRAVAMRGHPPEKET